ncbi:MAG: DUF4186 family protein [Candidatus Hodarchaeota archaeon]
MSAKVQTKKKLEPLKISCKSADCERGLHCFVRTRKMKITNPAGQCIYCGVKLVDSKRMYKRDIADAEYTFKTLKYEMWRHYYWHIEIDQKAINYARRKGIVGMRAAAEARIRNSVGAANPYKDGIQTPKKGNALYYAQHATATCCRKCIEDWHGIPIGQPLTDDQTRYFQELIMLYIEERLPFLTEHGEYVPPIRKAK